MLRRMRETSVHSLSEGRLSFVRLAAPRIAIPSAAPRPASDLPPSLPGLDIAGALRRVGGKTDLYRRLIQELAAQLPETLARVEQAAAEGAPGRVGELLHTLKGTAATMGLITVAEQATLLESALSSGVLLDMTALNAAVAGARDSVAEVLRWSDVQARSVTESSAPADDGGTRSAGNSARRKHRLLIVDDQQANLSVMAEALRDRYELFTARSGQRALQLAAEHDIELVLLDVVLPDLDGFEVCRRLKRDERTSRIPVIFVTAREEVHDEEHGFDAGGVDYIAKPIRPSIVRARVQTHLELKVARDLLESLASVDSLTGIANRRRFDIALSSEWRRCARDGSPFSLVLMDVDHFKNFNDTYGHARGDDCLRLVAGALAGTVRRTGDLAARYGGEEFALILPGSDSLASQEVVRMVLEQVFHLGITHRESSCSSRVSISAGAVTTVASPTQDVADVVECADRLLYEAKSNGRDRALHLDYQRGIRLPIAR